MYTPLTSKPTKGNYVCYRPLQPERLWATASITLVYTTVGSSLRLGPEHSYESARSTSRRQLGGIPPETCTGRGWSDNQTWHPKSTRTQVTQSHHSLVCDQKHHLVYERRWALVGFHSWSGVSETWTTGTPYPTIMTRGSGDRIHASSREQSRAAKIRRHVHGLSGGGHG